MRNRIDGIPFNNEDGTDTTVDPRLLTTYEAIILRSIAPQNSRILNVRPIPILHTEQTGMDLALPAFWMLHPSIEETAPQKERPQSNSDTMLNKVNADDVLNRLRREHSIKPTEMKLDIFKTS